MNTVKKMCYIAMLVAAGIVLSILESFIPCPIPGIKLGLANVITLYVLYKFGVLEAIFTQLIRVFLASLLRGTIFQMGFFMSLTGAVLALGIMILLKFVFKKLTIITVSVIGSIFHSIGQILVAIIYLGTGYVAYYLPLLVLISIGTGILTGILAKLMQRIPVFKNSQA